MKPITARMRSVSSWLAVALVPAFALMGAGFVGHARATSARFAEVQVTERDFHITAPKQVPNGNISLEVTNKGPDAHELIVVRAPGARLPLRSDGLTVNEEDLRPATEPSLDPGSPGSVRWLRLHLPPGRYVLFCNMSGHFMGGMHTVLVVR